MAGPKILIIDDEPAVQQAMKKALKGEGYKLFFAEDGKQGVKLIKQKTPDLIFLDLRMPVMDGVELLEKINVKHDDPYQVVVITGHGEDQDIDKCYTLGVTNFFRKPLSMTEITCLAKRCIKMKTIIINLALISVLSLITHYVNGQNSISKKTEPHSHAWACNGPGGSPTLIYRSQFHGKWRLGLDNGDDSIIFTGFDWSNISSLPKEDESFNINGQNWLIIKYPAFKAVPSNLNCSE